jgi:hypothetical protein
MSATRASYLAAGALLVASVALPGCTGRGRPQLPAPPFSAGDGFGTSVSISGQFAIVGAPYSDQRENDSGAAHVYRLDEQSWQYDALLEAVEGEPGDEFGGAVSVSNAYAVVGAHFSETDGRVVGAAYVFIRGSGNNWIRASRLAPQVGDDLDYFGSSVAIDGSVIAIGAPGSDIAANSAGAVYVYELIAGDWTEMARLTAPDADDGDRFGVSVSVDGERILAGAPHADGSAVNSGAVYVIERSGESWAIRARLVADDQKTMELGASVALSGRFAVAGAPADTTDVGVGSAIIFQELSDGWTYVDRLTGPVVGFGRSVDLSGADLVVGGTPANRGPGAAFAFAWTDAGWASMVHLVGNDTGLSDGFGRSVAVSGDIILVGADGDTNPEGNPGRVYSYSRSGKSWR